MPFIALDSQQAWEKPGTEQRTPAASESAHGWLSCSLKLAESLHTPQLSSEGLRQVPASQEQHRETLLRLLSLFQLCMVSAMPRAVCCRTHWRCPKGIKGALCLLRRTGQDVLGSYGHPTELQQGLLLSLPAMGSSAGTLGLLGLKAATGIQDFPERLKSAHLYRNREPGASAAAYQQDREL